MLSKLILSICVPRLLDATSPWESEHNSHLAQHSSAALTKLYNELKDCDVIYCVPSECFGDSTFPNQVQFQTPQGCARETEERTYRAGVHSSNTTGTDVAHSTTSEGTQNEASVPKPSAEFEIPSNSDMDPLTPTSGYRGQLELGLSQGGEICGTVLQFAKEFISDSIWTLGDSKNCAIAPLSLQLPTADDPSTAASDNRATTPPTLLDLNGFFPLELDELDNF